MNKNKNALLKNLRKLCKIKNIGNIREILTKIGTNY